MQATQSLRFSRKDSKKFFRTLNLRVNQYFKENKIQKTGNWKLYLKSLVMFSLLMSTVCTGFVAGYQLVVQTPHVYSDGRSAWRV